MIDGVLHGGPMHGRRIRIKPGCKAIQMPQMPQMLPPPPATPRPPWWRPLARRRWQPPPSPAEIKYQTLTYRYLATGDDGRPIFAYDQYALRPCDLDTDLREYLINHLYSVRPWDRRGMHWVMSREWFDLCREIEPDRLPYGVGGEGVHPRRPS